MNRRLIVILNDNEMSIAPPVGAMSNYLARLLSSPMYLSLRDFGKQVAGHLPRSSATRRRWPRNWRAASSPAARCSRSSASTTSASSTATTSSQLLPVLANVRDAEVGPILVHVRTQKGKGYAPAEASQRQVPRRRQVRRRHRQAAEVARRRARPTPRCSARAWCRKRARTTASSPSPRRCRPAPASTFSPRRFPTAPSMSASPSSTPSPSRRGWRRRASSRSPPSIRPSCSAPTTRWCTTWRSSACRCASHSTAPASSAPTGPTHAGSFDLAYLGCLPGFVLMAAADEAELMHMVATAAAIDDRPSRLPLSARRRRRRRASRAGACRWRSARGRVMREGSTVALVSLGARLADCLKAAETLAARGLSTTVVDARFAKPLDSDADPAAGARATSC